MDENAYTESVPGKTGYRLGLNALPSDKKLFKDINPFVFIYYTPDEKSGQDESYLSLSGSEVSSLKYDKKAQKLDIELIDYDAGFLIENETFEVGVPTATKWIRQTNNHADYFEFTPTHIFVGTEMNHDSMKPFKEWLESFMDKHKYNPSREGFPKTAESNLMKAEIDEVDDEVAIIRNQLGDSVGNIELEDRDVEDVSIEIYNDDGVLLEEIVLGAETFESDPEYDGMNYHGDLPYDVMKDAYEQARKEKRNPVIRDGKRVSVLNRADWEYYESDLTLEQGILTVYYQDPSDPHTIYEMKFYFDVSDVTPHDYGYWDFPNFNFDPVNPRGYASYIIGHGEDEGKILSSHKFTGMNAETNLSMNAETVSKEMVFNIDIDDAEIENEDELEERGYTQEEIEEIGDALNNVYDKDYVLEDLWDNHLDGLDGDITLAGHSAYLKSRDEMVDDIDASVYYRVDIGDWHDIDTKNAETFEAEHKIIKEESEKILIQMTDDKATIENAEEIIESLVESNKDYESDEEDKELFIYFQDEKGNGLRSLSYVVKGDGVNNAIIDWFSDYDYPIGGYTAENFEVETSSKGFLKENLPDSKEERLKDLKEDLEYRNAVLSQFKKLEASLMPFTTGMVGNLPKMEEKMKDFLHYVKQNIKHYTQLVTETQEQMQRIKGAETFEASGSGHFMETGGRMVTIDSDIEVNYNWQTDPYEIEDNYGEIQGKVEEKVREEYYDGNSGSGYMREEYLDEDNKYQDYEISYEWTKEVSDGAEEEIKSWAETDLSMNAETFEANAKSGDKVYVITRRCEDYSAYRELDVAIFGSKTEAKKKFNILFKQAKEEEYPDETIADAKSYMRWGDVGWGIESFMAGDMIYELNEHIVGNKGDFYFDAEGDSQ